MPTHNPDSASSSSITVPRAIIKNNVNCLPIELVSSILALVVFSSERVNSQFRLSWVCRYWRQIILENPIFWIIVSFDWHGLNQLEYMEKVVHSSGSRELVVFGPGIDDSENGSPAQTHFRSFLRREYKRVKALFLGDFDHRVTWLPNTVFENLQALSITEKSLPSPSDILAGARNLQVFQLTTHDQLPNIIPHLPRHLKKISLRLLSDRGVSQIFTLFKTLEYLSIFFMEKCEFNEITHRNRLSKQSLPNLKTFKSNNAGLIMDILHAPALQHLEITAPRDYQVEDDYSLLDSVDLSIFTHLYLGYLPNSDMDNPEDGCIWASVGPSTIPCVTHHQPSFFSCCDDGHRNTWPSSWSVFPQLPDSDDQVEPLVHIHTLHTYALDNINIRLPCKLVSRMTMLDTFVLCLPGEPYPRPRTPRPEFCEFEQITKLFHEITQTSLKLRNLIIRGGCASEEDVEILSECFNQEYWTSHSSCPLLESITYHVYTSMDIEVFWELWIRFLTGRKSIGRPLKHLHLIDCESPSGEVLSKLKGLSDTEITFISDEKTFEYVRIPDNGWEDEEYRLYPIRGF